VVQDKIVQDKIVQDKIVGHGKTRSCGLVPVPGARTIECVLKRMFSVYGWWQCSVEGRGHDGAIVDVLQCNSLGRQTATR